MSTKHGPKSSKGKKIQGKAAKGKRGAKAAPVPEAVAEEAAPEATDLTTPIDEVADTDPMDTCPGIPVTPDVPEVHVAQNPAPEGDPATKRKRNMTIDDLVAEYERVIQRSTTSRSRRYLLWKLAEAAHGRIPLGPVQRRTPRDKADLQVLPLSMGRPVVAKLDAAWKALGFKSRMAFLRDGMVAYLRGQEGAEANAAADALEAEGF